MLTPADEELVTAISEALSKRQEIRFAAAPWQLPSEQELESKLLAAAAAGTASEGAREINLVSEFLAGLAAIQASAGQLDAARGREISFAIIGFACNILRPF